MSTSGTYAFNPAGSSLVLTAFARMGIRRTEIIAQHMADAEQEMNLLQVEFGNRQPNLWLDELYTVSLTSGTATYTLPARMIAIQAAYITTTSGGVSTDRILWPISTFEYAALPDKTDTGPPTSFWLNMQITPQITLWPVPDDNATYTLNLRMLHQIEDASIGSGTQVAVPYRWLDAWVAALAARLAQIYKPDMVQALDMKAERAWQIAAAQDVEQVPTFIIPAFEHYFSR